MILHNKKTRFSKYYIYLVLCYTPVSENPFKAYKQTKNTGNDVLSVSVFENFNRKTNNWGIILPVSSPIEVVVMPLLLFLCFGISIGMTHEWWWLKMGRRHHRWTFVCYHRFGEVFLFLLCVDVRIFSEGRERVCFRAFGIYYFIITSVTTSQRSQLFPKK